MKRKNPSQPGLFDAEQFPLLDCEQADDKPEINPDYVPHSLGASVTLDGKPAKIIGGSTAQYATIEPLDIDDEPIRCCWDIVREILDEHEGRFQRSDDDTDE